LLAKLNNYLPNRRQKTQLTEILCTITLCQTDSFQLCCLAGTRCYSLQNDNLLTKLNFIQSVLAGRQSNYQCI